MRISRPHVICDTYLSDSSNSGRVGREQGTFTFTPKLLPAQTQKFTNFDTLAVDVGAPKTTD